MAKAIEITGDWAAADLRRLAGGSRHSNQSRRLLSIAAVLDGMSRADAARIGGMDRQTLRDWVHRFNALGPGWLMDNRRRGQPKAAVGCAVGGPGPDRGNRPGPHHRRRDAVAARRHPARHREAVRGGLSQAHHWQAAQGPGLFGAICPARGVGAALALPFPETEPSASPRRDRPACRPKAHTPCCCSTAPDGTPPAISSGRGTSRRSCCRRARRNSIRSSRSGSISAPTTSPTASSTTTTPPSTPPATRGENSSPSRRR
jgi:hypothetical protein